MGLAGVVSLSVMCKSPLRFQALQVRAGLAVCLRPFFVDFPVASLGLWRWRFLTCCHSFEFVAAGQTLSHSLLEAWRCLISLDFGQ